MRASLILGLSLILLTVPAQAAPGATAHVSAVSKAQVRHNALVRLNALKAAGKVPASTTLDQFLQSAQFKYARPDSITGAETSAVAISPYTPSGSVPASLKPGGSPPPPHRTRCKVCRKPH